MATFRFAIFRSLEGTATPGTSSWRSGRFKQAGEVLGLEASGKGEQLVNVQDQCCNYLELATEIGPAPATPRFNSELLIFVPKLQTTDCTEEPSPDIVVS